MSMIRQLFSRAKRPSVKPGLVIPYTRPAIAEPPSRALMVRPAMSLVAVSALCFFLYTQADSLIAARLSQPASPVVVATETWPYQQRTLAEGPSAALADSAYYQTVVQGLVAATPHVLGVDMAAKTLTYYHDGQAVLVAQIRDYASAESWRYLGAGYYEVDTTIDERYSSLEQAYYPHLIELSPRIAIHGPAYRNDGTPVAAASLGVTIGAEDAATLAAVLPVATPVVVHVPGPSTVAATELVPAGPAVAARSYLVAELASGRILAADKAATVVPIASLTKLMTALIVAEDFDLEGEILIDQEQYVTTLIPRLPGTYRSSVYDLLQLLLLESSNEAAEVLATHLGRDVFIARMNERARELGLLDTVFIDPSGLDDGNQSSANDLFTLTAFIAEQYPFLLHVTSNENALEAARVSDFTEVENFNRIDGLNDFRGGKIGETEAARKTSVSLHQMTFSEDVRMVVIILLGSETRTEDVTTLHQYVHQRYR